MTSRRGGVGLLLVLASACRTAAPPASTAVVDTAFAAVPDSAWIVVTGPTLIAFHPRTTNARLEADQDLASALDDFAYGIGSAMDSLRVVGYAVTYQAGDTVWIRIGATRSRFVRAADSSSIGYLFADSAGHTATVYGVLTSIDLIQLAHRFKEAGTLH